MIAPLSKLTYILDLPEYHHHQQAWIFMCLIVFSYQPHSAMPLLLAANRDEFFVRPTAPATYWEDSPQVFAGRDLVAQGTWLGITTKGRFAAITNVREPSVTVNNPLSRGDLTREFLESDCRPEDYLNAIASSQSRYCGFNLLLGQLGEQQNQTQDELWYFSNRGGEPQRLQAGTYGLSNHLLDSPWPKVTAGKHFIDDLQKQATFSEANTEQRHGMLRTFLEDTKMANDDELPKTGVSYEREKALSAAFITLPDYGTRTSTALSIQHNTIAFSEKSYRLDVSKLIPNTQDYNYQEWPLTPD
ncbi:NRDE family protein [Eionea flava]